MIPRLGGYWARLAGAVFALLLCAPAPATAQFSLMSPEQEKEVGAQEHPKVIAQFGGVYDDPEVTGYVAEVGGRLAANSENPEIGYTFTLLNDPIVNAFALPGGYVYVTRGLMALANNEAELASVLAHEIGHVTARHSAQRQTRGTVLGIGSMLLGAVLGSAELGQLAQAGSQLYLKSYSRDQEYDADVVGVKVLARTGYAPTAAAAFLGSMGRHTELERSLAGLGKEGSDFFATHPRTMDRVERAIEAAGEVGTGRDAPLRREEYQRAIDGLLWGDDPEQGVIRDRKFMHPGLRFVFEVPEDFRLTNSERAVMAAGPEGARIRFDAESNRQYAQMDPARYVSQVWGQKLALQNVESITVNGLPGATGVARAQADQGPVTLRLVAVRFPDRLHRLLFLTPVNVTQRFDEAFRRTTYSLRQLSESEAGAIKPLRIRLVQVRDGGTAADIAKRMPFGDHQLERFLVLNGLDPDASLPPGATVKVISE